MRKGTFGFTLIELLVVMAIVLTLAALLFPVFVTVKGAANRTVCVANFKQAYEGTTLYVADYDDRLMPTNHQPTAENSRSDRTWVQLILPYVNDFAIFRCPSDYGNRPKPEATFDEDLVPGDTTSRYYQASKRSNIGYNYLYLAPVIQNGPQFDAEPHLWAEVSNPSTSLLFVDTVYQLVDGKPNGGGNYLAIPPCRYEINDSGKFDTFLARPAGEAEVLAQNKGWTDTPNSSFIYGGAWPWHLGKITVCKLDGSVKVISPEALAEGCEVKQNWSGLIQDPTHYIWHIQF